VEKEGEVVSAANGVTIQPEQEPEVDAAGGMPRGPRLANLSSAPMGTPSFPGGFGNAQVEGSGVPIGSRDSSARDGRIGGRAGQGGYGSAYSLQQGQGQDAGMGIRYRGDGVAMGQQRRVGALNAR
jgi:hypothetical protein